MRNKLGVLRCIVQTYIQEACQFFSVFIIRILMRHTVEPRVANVGRRSATGSAPDMQRFEFKLIVFCSYDSAMKNLV